MNTQNKNENLQKRPRDPWKRRIFELVLFAMLGSLMFCSKVIMEVLPNIHLLGMFTITFTLVFRVKALIPIYVNVFLTGLYGGFNLWWMPYLYIWTILWALAMLIPKRRKAALAAQRAAEEQAVQEQTTAKEEKDHEA